MQQIRITLALSMLAAGIAAPLAEIVAPGNRPVPPGHHALTHATAVTKPGVKIEDATVVIHNGRIVSVTKQGEAPDTARVWDMSGMTLYAGFIDPYVTDAKPLSTTMTQSITGREATAAGKPGFFGTTGNERDPGQTGPGSGLSTMKPDFHVADEFSPKRDTYDEYRKQGFTAVALTPSSGIVRGQSALISLGQGSPNELIIKPNLFQHIVFDPQAAKQEEFPRSLMGVIAAIRQTLSDAQHYKATWDYYQQNATSFERPAYNQALAALQPAIQGSQPTVMEPGSVLMIDKAVRLGAEFGIKPILVASGQEWRRPDLIKATGAQFIVPLILPKAPKMPSDSDWENVSLGQLRAWDWAPEVPAMLQKNGQPISLTLHGLKDKNHFRANLAKAIERGLAKRDALAALTTAPAKLTGVSDQLGTIETGKLANLVMVEGDYFDPKAKIRGVWIEGIWNSFEPQKLAWIDKKKDQDKKKNDEKKEKKDEPEEDKLIALSPIEEDTIFEPESKTVLVRNATIWTSSKRGILKKSDLLIVDGKIKQVGRGITAPEEAHVINAKGHHVTPGLIDAHVHIEFDPCFPLHEQPPLDEARQLRRMRERARSMLIHGITTARDLGGKGLALTLRDDIAAGRSAGPRLLVAGAAVTTPGGHCHQWGGAAAGVEPGGGRAHRGRAQQSAPPLLSGRAAEDQDKDTAAAAAAAAAVAATALAWWVSEGYQVIGRPGRQRMFQLALPLHTRWSSSRHHHGSIA